MEIIVQGIAKKSYMPDEVNIQLEFYRKENTYAEALEKGTKDVEMFIEKVLKSMNLEKDILKTQSFRIYEETKFDYETKQEIKLGFVYSQGIVLNLDYSIEKMAEWIGNLVKLENAPRCNISFKLKSEEKCKTEVIAEAFENAKKRAEIIARIEQKELKKCLKTDFKPFEQNVLYGNSFNASDMINSHAKAFMCKGMNATELKETIQTIFTPEEIEIQEAVYCLWVAE